MNVSTPNKAVPGGCVIGLLGCILLVAAGTMGWGVRVLSKIPVGERSDEWLSEMWKLGAGGVACLLLGLALIYFGMRSAWGVKVNDPFAESKPKMRF